MVEAEVDDGGDRNKRRYGNNGNKRNLKGKGKRHNKEEIVTFYDLPEKEKSYYTHLVVLQIGENI